MLRFLCRPSRIRPIFCSKNLVSDFFVTQFPKNRFVRGGDCKKWISHHITEYLCPSRRYLHSPTLLETKWRSVQRNQIPAPGPCIFCFSLRIQYLRHTISKRNRVIQLFSERLGYVFLGSWEERENSNIEERICVSFCRSRAIATA